MLCSFEEVKLRELGISPNCSVEYITDIFGRQVGTVREEGLVDSSSGEEFDDRLEKLEQVWSNRASDGGRRFYTYFNSYVADVIKYNTCRDV